MSKNTKPELSEREKFELVVKAAKVFEAKKRLNTRELARRIIAHAEKNYRRSWLNG